MSCHLCDTVKIKARGLCSAHYQSETAAGRIEQYPKAVRAPIEMAIRRRCPKHHKHGLSHTCYNTHGCRCAACRRAKAKKRALYDRRYRQMQGRDVWVPALGTVRRLRALAVIGWSIDEIATRAGLFHRSLLKVREGQRAEVHSSTWRAVRRVYAELENTTKTDRPGKITRTRALQHGWFPPAMWDNPDFDPEPSAKITGVAA